MAKLNKKLLLKLLCELIASLLVQFFGCICSYRTSKFVFYVYPIEYAFSWGGAIIATTHIFRIVSGAHINPCISIASMILRNVEVIDGLFYILSQLIGSFIGFGIAYLMAIGPYKAIRFCCTEVIVHPWWKALVVEFFTTGVWVLAMCSSWHQLNVDMVDSISLRIGLVTVAAILVGTRYSNTCMNPFRSLWPALLGGYFDHIYIYVGMPVITAILLAFAWRYIILLNKDETLKQDAGDK